jgi:hypothetical protein
MFLDLKLTRFHGPLILTEKGVLMALAETPRVA